MFTYNYTCTLIPNILKTMIVCNTLNINTDFLHHLQDLGEKEIEQLKANVKNNVTKRLVNTVMPIV